MKIYGYTNDNLEPAETVVPSLLTEITLVASPDELRKIAKFIEMAADGMEKNGKRWEHEHLSDKFNEFENSPHFIIFNPSI